MFGVIVNTVVILGIISAYMYFKQGKKNFGRAFAEAITHTPFILIGVIIFRLFNFIGFGQIIALIVGSFAAVAVMLVAKERFPVKWLDGESAAVSAVGGVFGAFVISLF